jgi:hypothetical protein
MAGKTEAMFDQGATTKQETRRVVEMAGKTKVS